MPAYISLWNTAIKQGCQLTTKWEKPKSFVDTREKNPYIVRVNDQLWYRPGWFVTTGILNKTTRGRLWNRLIQNKYGHQDQRNKLLLIPLIFQQRRFLTHSDRKSDQMSNLCIKEFLTTIIHCSRVPTFYISLPGSLNIIIQ